MTCENFQDLKAGLGATTVLTVTPTFPFDNVDEIRVDIFDYVARKWVPVPRETGVTGNFGTGGTANDFYSWTVSSTGVVTTQLATNDTVPALPSGATAKHPLVPNTGTDYPVSDSARVNVRVYRRTSIAKGEMPAIFYPGSSVKAEDLNENFEVLRRVVEESACSTNNITDGSDQLDARYWNKVPDSLSGDTITSADTWSADDTHIATTAAIEAFGDDRWLNDAGDIVGGDSIKSTEASDKVTLDIDLATDGGLESTNTGDPTGQLKAKPGNGVTVTSSGINVGQGTGITVNTNDVAVSSVTVWGQTHNHGANVSGDMSGVGDITLTTGDRSISGGTGDLTIGRDLVLQSDKDISLGGVKYNPPSADGSNGNGLITDGNGNLSWGAVGIPDGDITITGNLTVEGDTTLGNEDSDSVTISGDLTVDHDTTFGSTASDQHQMHGDLTILGDSDIKFIGRTTAADKGSALFRAPATFKNSSGSAVVDLTYTLPPEGPTDGQVLTSDSSGNLSWGAGGSGGGTNQNLGTTYDTDKVTVTITSGTNTDINVATDSQAGVLSKGLFTKLNNLPSDAEKNVPTNITVVEGADTVEIQSSTGSNDSIAAATNTTAGVMTKGMFEKLDGITEGAQPNVDPSQTYTAATNKGTLTLTPGSDTTDLPLADDTNAGLMSPAEHKKLNGLPGNASGVLNLEDLNDVTISSIVEGQVIRWNDTDNRWENQDLFSNSTVLRFMGVVDTRDTNPTIPYGDIVPGMFWVHDDPSESDPANVAGTAQRDQAVPSGWTTIDNPGSGSEADGTNPLSVVRGSMLVAGREYDIGGTMKRGFMRLGTLSAGTIAGISAGDGITVVESGGAATISQETISGLTADEYGDATNIPKVTVDTMGRVTAIDTDAISVGVTSLTAGTGISIDNASSASPTVKLKNLLTASQTYTNASITTDANGVISAVSSGTEADTTYSLATAASGTGITLTPSSGSADTVTLTQSGGLSITRTSASELTLSSANDNDNTTYSFAAGGTDNSTNPTLDLTAGGSGSGTDSVQVVGGTNITVTKNNSGQITIDAAGGGSGSVTEVTAGTSLQVGDGTGGSSITSSGTLNVKNKGIDTAQIADNAVSTTQIASSSVTATELADNAVTRGKIKDQEVLATKMAGISTNGQSGQVLLSDAGGGFTWGNRSPSGTVTSVGASGGLTTNSNGTAGGSAITGSGSVYMVNVLSANDATSYGVVTATSTEPPKATALTVNRTGQLTAVATGPALVPFDLTQLTELTT